MFKKLKKHAKKKLKKLSGKIKNTGIYKDTVVTIKVLKKDAKRVSKSSRKYKRKIDHFLLAESPIKIG